MDQLRARLAAQLDALAAERPDLTPAVGLQRALLSRQVDLLDVLRSGGLPGLTMPAGYLAAKLKRGVPILHGEPIPLPGRLLEMAAREFCETLAAGGAGDAAAGVAAAIDRRAIDPGALISACFGRDQRRVRFMAVRESVSPDLAWLVAELAVAPFAHLLQRRALADAGYAVASAVQAWDRGFCPACGSWPAVVEVVDGRHALRCSFCAAGWELSTYRCA
jgi:FdhE protein